MDGIDSHWESGSLAYFFSSLFSVTFFFSLSVSFLSVINSNWESNCLVFFLFILVLFVFLSTAFKHIIFNIASTVFHK